MARKHNLDHTTCVFFARWARSSSRSNVRRRKNSTMFDLPLCLILTSTLFLTLIKADCDERAFLALYGNNNETSGVWQAVRNISSDATKLRWLCYLAHRQTRSPITDMIDTISFEPQTLTFTRYEKSTLNREPMLVDVVSYNVTRQPPFELPEHHFFHFTKGAKKGCVFYLIKWGKSRPAFRVGLHFCDVEVPE